MSGNGCKVAYLSLSDVSIVLSSCQQDVLKNQMDPQINLEVLNKTVRSLSEGDEVFTKEHQEMLSHDMVQDVLNLGVSAIELTSLGSTCLTRIGA